MGETEDPAEDWLFEGPERQSVRQAFLPDGRAGVVGGETACQLPAAVCVRDVGKRSECTVRACLCEAGTMILEQKDKV